MGESQKREGQIRENWKERSSDYIGEFGKSYEKRKTQQQETARQEDGKKFRRENKRNDSENYRKPKPNREFQSFKKEEEEQKPKAARSLRNHLGKEKSLENQPDMAELTSRWEKEKEKKMEKKNIENKREMRETSGRPVAKKRRQNNIDWTREYENDSFDDDVYYNY